MIPMISRISYPIIAKTFSSWIRESFTFIPLLYWSNRKAFLVRVIKISSLTTSRSSCISLWSVHRWIYHILSLLGFKLNCSISTLLHFTVSLLPLNLYLIIIERLSILNSYSMLPCNYNGEFIDCTFLTY